MKPMKKTCVLPYWQFSSVAHIVTATKIAGSFAPTCCSWLHRPTTISASKRRESHFKNAYHCKCSANMFVVDWSKGIRRRAHVFLKRQILEHEKCQFDVTISLTGKINCAPISMCVSSGMCIYIWRHFHDVLRIQEQGNFSLVVSNRKDHFQETRAAISSICYEGEFQTRKWWATNLLWGVGKIHDSAWLKCRI